MVVAFVMKTEMTNIDYFHTHTKSKDLAITWLILYNRFFLKSCFVLNAGLN